MKKKNFLDYLYLFCFTAIGFIFLIPIIFYCFMLVTGTETRKLITWDDFKSEHNCKIVSIDKGFFSTKTGWLCDDNITYYIY